MNSIRLKSPAKLNLYLKVINKRKDGYHNLVTVFERINLCDDIKMTANTTGAIRIRSNNSELPTGPKNLIYRVAKLLQKEFSVFLGVDVAITKRIPIAAGLGGGSSNAATALLGLNKIWNLHLNIRQLAALGERIGSDVPFFLYDYNWALGVERGNKIQKLPSQRKLWHILVVPRIKVYSGEVFGALKLPAGPFLAPATSPKSPLKGISGAPTNILTKARDDVNILTRALRKDDLLRIGSLLSNDLETTIVRLHPNLSKIKNKLKILKAVGVVFSGSGPAVFGLAESSRQAHALKAILSKKYAQVFAVCTL
ncbi:MAG TPA: 4-(cytidine 5'-diphospho)-2-C-methyl-D-erythritol kinase [Candidatus Omnitrophota bacterium]|nr:4-(cytidine 5'-diphospho)-2-C-methyl-D-erythritol kinase [Candidatus Omnitrophota bacterium]HPD84315.1 4-(cytidine 5'-diphospho)-2-C-methyl-D-erythritol kinase [Candidatus Omnitrophota bacterium]HRZ03172.1 4-(cytidine 5'-diphospho)-2-C-methyl-D-erythritol kinase [Candidatus Omnitrophota bacterium]